MQALRAGAANYIPKKRLARDLVSDDPASPVGRRAHPRADRASSAVWFAASQRLCSTTIPS